MPPFGGKPRVRETPRKPVPEEPRQSKAQRLARQGETAGKLAHGILDLGQMCGILHLREG
jgi:hypothetical protein